jgi:hypothetical protein
MRDAWNSRLRQDYEKWLENNDPNKVECLSDDELRQLIMNELEYVSAMSVEEYVLYQKWCEIQRKYPTREVSTLFGQEQHLVESKQKHTIDKAKSMIWMPESPEDYLKLEPELILTDYNDWLLEQFQTIRTLCHTQRNHNNIGRNMYYLVVDKPTGKYLGVVTISSDFIDLTPRDNFVGWTREQRNGGMLLHTAIGSSILPTQPLGYNYVGGKLLALLCLSDEVQNTWKERYGQTLVGVTTTSLYGSFSQYNNLRHWNKRGKTTGKVVFEPTRPTLYKIRDWVHKKDPVRYWELWFALNDKGQKYKRDHKFRMLGFVYSQLKIKNTESQHQRGIYFSHLYENTPEFLRQEITDDKLVKRFDTSTEYLVDLWKNKYASKRIKSLIGNDRVSNTSLFYDDLIYKSWDDTKEKYLEQVGR